MEKKQNWYVNQRKYHFIYKIICSVTNRYYIGMHSTDDLEDGYLGSGSRLARSKRKYGKDSHSIERLEFLPDRESLRKREEELVTEELLKDPLCMNLIMGGGDFHLTPNQYDARNKKCNSLLVEKIKSDPELKKNFSDQMANKNKTHSKRWNVISNKTRCIGRVASQDTKDRLSVSQSGEKNSQYGSVWIFNMLLKVSKRVSKEEVEAALTEGWLLGRKMKF